MQAYFKEQKALLDRRESDLNNLGRELATCHLTIESEVSRQVEKGIQEKLPPTIKQLQYD